MDTLQLVLAIIGLAFIMGGQTAAICRFLLNRIDEGDRMNREHRSKQVKDLHDRIADVKENYVRRDDFHHSMQRLEKSLDKLHLEVQDHARSMNTRMDTVLTGIANIAKNHLHKSASKE